MKKSAALLGLLVVLAGCGGGGATSTAPVVSPAHRSYLGTQAPGDVWSWQLNDTTFTATNQTLGTHYSGTKSILSTGFMKLTVTATDDANLTPGQSAYALELPGTALLIKPAGADTKPPIVAGALGSNPAGPQVSFNFVAIGSANYDRVNDQAYGHVTYDVSGNTYAGMSHRWNIDGSPLSDGPSNFTGDNGLMTDTNGPMGYTATGAMTPSGVCVLDYGPNVGGVIGVMQPSANINISDFASRSFKGYLINSGKTQCVSVTSNGNGTLHGSGYANPMGVETGTLDGGSGVTISFTGQPNPGELTTTLTTSGGTETLTGIVNQVGGKYMMFCFGVGSDNKPYNVVLVEN